MKTIFTAVLALFTPALCFSEPLPSWNDGTAGMSITAFVEKVTTAGPPDFESMAERIAVFDNDGTLWVPQGWLNREATALAAITQDITPQK